MQFITDPGGLPNDFFYTISPDQSSKRFLIGASGFGSNTGKVVFDKIIQ